MTLNNLKFKNILGTLIFSALFISCSKDPITSLGEHNLKVKDPIEFESGLQFEITAVEDSRCPLEVVCVWAGEAVVTFNVSMGNKSEIIQLGKCIDPGELCKPSKIELLNHHFELIEVSPFPQADVEVKERDWVVRMSIEEL